MSVVSGGTSSLWFVGTPAHSSACPTLEKGNDSPGKFGGVIKEGCQASSALDAILLVGRSSLCPGTDLPLNGMESGIVRHKNKGAAYSQGSLSALGFSERRAFAHVRDSYWTIFPSLLSLKPRGVWCCDLAR